MNNSIIEVEHLVKKFGDLVAVDDINFHVEKGEAFGFLGPNGAGKTTTISILCTLLKPTSGTVTLNGFNVQRQAHQARRSLGLVFQDPSLDIRLTALQNLKFHAHIYGIPRRVCNSRIEDVLKMVQLWDRRNDDVKNFSGGMRRRLEIARGLLHYPQVLFLDEPTLGLDPQTRFHIWDYVLELKHRENITIFLTTHYMDEANIADRIAIIDNGKIVALDTPQALKNMVGGDIITLKTDDNHTAREEIITLFGIEAKQDRDGISFETANGEEFIPKLTHDLNTNVISIGLRRPTLDDVFLKVTGHEMREENGGEAVDKRIWTMRQAGGRAGRFH
ncbi:MAG: ATP-binding cassette domain-containing protein [Chloroflexota bacterium]|nr:ATP-binding cassette domain-containing protein [Chloroflexota bacterium]